MTPTRKTYLIDGPLMLAPERKAAMILQMAKVLLAHGATDDLQTAQRCLHRDGYSGLDVIMLGPNALDEARHQVQLEVVAREMSDE